MMNAVAVATTEEFRDVANQVGINDSGEICCRDIWRFLGVKSEYNHWFKRRSAELTLEKGNDFNIVFSDDLAGKPKVDHFVCPDTAKEMAMLERNQAGRRLRKYFIEVEKKFREASRVAQLKPEPPVQTIESKLENAKLAVCKLKEIYDVMGMQSSEANDAIFSFLDGNLGLDIKPSTPAPIIGIEQSIESTKNEEQWVNPTNLGIYLDVITNLGEKLSGRKVNKLLCAAGLQEKVDTSWKITTKGKQYSFLEPISITVGKQSKIKPQILWDKDKTAQLLLDECLV
ncbi:MAG: antA/AntB antirepressor family protein [Oligoflexales bacterium]|nr:antA/AntB antirepressor family protein [Oligoflexales bacterium]